MIWSAPSNGQQRTEFGGCLYGEVETLVWCLPANN